MDLRGVRIQIGPGRLSIFLSCDLSGGFLGIGSLDFLEFWDGSRNPFEVVLDRVGDFGEKYFFFPINWGSRPKTGQQ